MLLDILSHELRTPITTIYGGAQVLATRDLTPSRRRALAADIRTEADRLYRLVEDLVLLLRADRDGIRPIEEPVSVGRLVASAVASVVIRRPEIEVLLLGTSDAAADGADEVLVTHVMRNLLDNAIHYGAAGGPIEVVVSESVTEVAVRIIDRGPPPRPDEHPFALSAKSQATAAGRAGGGIGLYVADRLVEAMHGRIWAIPAEPSGAEFGFALKRSAVARAADA